MILKIYDGKNDRAKIYPILMLVLTRIQFKVSARKARFIGRENVATSKGAIIELVKNGYDADSRYCIVLIDNRYGVYHSKITNADYIHLTSLGIDKSLLFVSDIAKVKKMTNKVKMSNRQNYSLIKQESYSNKTK